MKALVYLAPEQMEMMEVPVPILEPGEVLIKVAFSGICGSELSGYMGHNALRKPPMIFGHEFSGTIVDLCEGSNLFGLQANMRVTVNPLITCGKCSYCNSGVESLCPERKLLSAALPGSNAEYVKVPAEFVYPLEDHVSLEAGALTEPVACGVRVAELTAAGAEDVVMIVGMGPIGIFALQAVLLQGAKHVIAVDLSNERLDFAASLGAHTINSREQNVEECIRGLTDGRGVDAAIDAVGAAITRLQCVSSVAAGGRVIFTGLHQAETTLDINDLVRREIKLFGSFAYSKNNFKTALEWVSTGNINLGDRITIATLPEGPEWFSKLVHAPGKEIKILLDVRGEDTL